jgi:hypothetical protein
MVNGKVFGATGMQPHGKGTNDAKQRAPRYWRVTRALSCLTLSTTGGWE